MIQLSDTKAAPGLGVMPGQKPKAGGDASAFALALGTLVTDGQSGFSMALPRQAVAAGGSALPEDQGDAETGEGIGAETGLIFSTIPITRDVPMMTPERVGIEGEPPLPGTPAPIKAGPVTLQSPSLPSIEPKQAPADKTTEIIGAKPVDPDATPNRPADASVAPLADVPGPIARALADTARAVPTTIEATPMPAVVPLAPTAAPAQAPTTPRTEKTMAATPAAGPSPAALPAKSIAPTPIPSEPALLAAARSAPIDRPALTARLQAAPANAAAPRREGATAKSPLDPVASATVAVPSARAESTLPTPAKFMPVERAVGAPSDRAAPRRIAVLRDAPAAISVTAQPITVANLIPVEYRPRTGTAPVVAIADPASIGMTAPVESASDIAEPAPIDTQATDWIEGMIEQIDVMRDAHAENASETTTTRIRLSPDALGGIEITLSGEGNAIDVRINADTAAARTLLAEAAPRLADMAEARGLKLGQGEAGQSGHHQAQRQQNQDQPIANRGRTPDSATTGGNSDERIA